MKAFTLKWLIPIAVLGVAILLAAVMIKTRRQIQPRPREPIVPLVRAIAVNPQSHRFTVQAQGTVLPRTDINLVAEVAGRIVIVAPAFAAGGFFEQDELLVKIDPRDYELAVTSAKAALAEARVRLAREEAESEVAIQEWRSLEIRGEPSPLVKREPQLAEARAVLTSAKAALEKAELDLERCQLKAPFAGRVWNKKVDVGQFVNKGEVLARIYAVDYAEVRLPLSLDELGFVELPVAFRGETAPGPQPKVLLRAHIGTETHQWEGRIVRTEGEIDQRTRMLTAVVRVNDPYGRSTNSHRPPLAVGMFVDAEIQGREAGQVWIVPRAAIRGIDQLMVVDKERRLRFRRVDVARKERDQVVIRGGLHEGDLVCVSPVDAPVDGMKVKLAEKDSAPEK